MARDAELRAKITAQDDASKVIEKAAKAADDFEKPRELKLDAEVAGALAALDQVAAEAKATAEAAEVLGRALGPELAAKADTTAIVGDLQQMGLTLDQIKGNADELGGKMRELADADVGGKLGGSLGTARGKLDEVGASADSSKNALANMVGNSVQDVSGLGGALGVAAGQMAEFSADAVFGGEGIKSVASNMLAAAGPIAAIALVVGTITTLLNNQAAEAEAAAARTKQFGDAMDGAADKGGALVDTLKENSDMLTEFNAHAEGFGANIVEGLAEVGKAVPVLGGVIGDAGQNISDLIPIMKAADFSARDFADAIANGGRVGDEWWKKLREGVKAGKITEDQYLALSGAIEQYGIEATKGKAITDFFAASTDAAGGSVDANAVKLVYAAKMMENWATETQAAAAGAKEFNDTVASTDFGAAGLQGGLAGMSTFHEQFFGLKDMAAANEEAFDNLSKSIEDNGDSFDLNTDKGRNNQKALEDLASAIDVQLVAAYDNADGSLAEFNTSAENVASTLRSRLINEMGLSATKADELIAQLGLMPEDIETRYRLSGDEEAKVKIGLLQSSIEALPKDVQAVVTQKIIMGDYVGALGTVQDYYNRHPVTVPVELRVSTANLTAAQQAAINAGRSAPGQTAAPAPAGMAVVPFGATAAAAPGVTSTMAPIVVPVAFKLPTAADVVRRIGPIRLPLYIKAGLAADQRIAGTL